MDRLIPAGYSVTDQVCLRQEALIFRHSQYSGGNRIGLHLREGNQLSVNNNGELVDAIDGNMYTHQVVACLKGPDHKQAIVVKELTTGEWSTIHII